MDMELLTKSLPLQIALGGGYLGYVTAYAGIRGHHQQTDIAFLTVAFGLVATVATSLLAYVTGGEPPAWLSVLVGVVASVVAGGLWRKSLRGWARRLLHLARVSQADDDPSVLSTIFGQSDYDVSQVKVEVEDGRDFVCDDMADFSDAAIRPLIIGSDGSVGLYVTTVKKPRADGTKEVKPQQSVRDEAWGDNMTIIPAARVRQIDLRFKKKKRT